MNIIHFLCVAIIFMGGTEPYVVEESAALHPTNEQWILLRKLQNFNDSKAEAKPLTWNEILADVLVNRIKVFSFKTQENINEEKKSPLTNFFGQILVIYKRFFYDKFHRHTTGYGSNGTEIIEEEVKDVTTVEPELEMPYHHQDTLVNDKKNTTNPKEEVEIIEPRYHGKLAGSEESADLNKEVEDCPEGYVKVENVCVNDKSKLILAVPNQCPIGYRRDELGYCRMMI